MLPLSYNENCLPLNIDSTMIDTFEPSVSAHEFLRTELQCFHKKKKKDKILKIRFQQPHKVENFEKNKIFSVKSRCRCTHVKKG